MNYINKNKTLNNLMWNLQNIQNILYQAYIDYKIYYHTNTKMKYWKSI